jgi:hypothetical protein
MSEESPFSPEEAIKALKTRQDKGEVVLLGLFQVNDTRLSCHGKEEILFIENNRDPRKKPVVEGLSGMKWDPQCFADEIRQGQWLRFDQKADVFKGIDQGFLTVLESISPKS